MAGSRYSVSVFIIMIVTALLSASCGSKKKRIEEEYVKFSSAPVEIPKEMLCVRDGKIGVDSLGNAPFKFIYYIDSTECSSCSIAHLSAFNRLIDLSERNGRFDMLIIFSPKVKNARAIAEDINIYEYDSPVYVDHKAEFRNRNMHIPSNRMFHQFLLKEDNTPAIVGSPLAGKQMERLFYDTLTALGITD